MMPFTILSMSARRAATFWPASMASNCSSKLVAHFLAASQQPLAPLRSQRLVGGEDQRRAALPELVDALGQRLGVLRPLVEPLVGLVRQMVQVFLAAISSSGTSRGLLQPQLPGAAAATLPGGGPGVGTSRTWGKIYVDQDQDGGGQGQARRPRLPLPARPAGRGGGTTTAVPRRSLICRNPAAANCSSSSPADRPSQ